MIKTFEAFKRDSFEMPKASPKRDSFTMPRKDIPTESELKDCLMNNPDLLYSLLATFGEHTDCFVVYNNEEGLVELFGELEQEVIAEKFANGYYSKENKYVGFDDKGYFKSFDDLYEHVGEETIDKIVVLTLDPKNKFWTKDYWDDIIKCIKR